jgi:hypothetical protein
MNTRHVTALGMIGLAMLVSFPHAVWAQRTIQTAYTFSCTQDAVRIDPLCLGALSESRVTVLSMVNLCASPSSFVLVSGRSQVPVLTLEPDEELIEPMTFTVPAGWVVALQTDPEGCEESEEEDDEFICLNVTSTIQFDVPPLFCRESQ